jgi:branched-chain amino acid transport system substrate-binding protein
MRTEPAQPPPPVSPRAHRARRVLFVVGFVLAVLFAASACSSEGPTLEPTGVVEPTGSEAESSSEVAPEETGDADTVASDEGTDDVEASVAAAPELDGEPVLVGVLLDSTNLMATTDRQPGVAFVEAIERIAAEGGLDGRPVEVRWINTTSRLSVIDAEAVDLIEAGADLLVVTCEFDFARPAVERAVEAGVLVISPCGPETGWGNGDLGRTAFSMMPAVETLGAVMAEHVWAEGHREISIVVDETAPEPRAECRGFQERWNELGGQIATELQLNLVTAEALAQDAERLDELRADALVLCSFVRVADAVVESVRGQALRVPIIAGPTLDTGVWIPEDLDAPLRDFTMLTLASTVGDDPADAVLAAAAEFLVADGIPPNNGRFVLGADLAAAYGIAVTRAGTTDGVAVADELRALVGEPLVSGEVTFGGRQAPDTWPLRVMRYEAGTFVNDGLVVDTSAQ